MKTALVFFAALLCMSIAAAEPPSLVPDISLEPEVVVSAEPLSVITVEQCGNLVALVIVDTAGALHPLGLVGKSLADVQALLSRLPDDPARRLNVAVACPPPDGIKAT